MVLEVYNYLDEIRLAVDVPRNLSIKLSRNMEESASPSDNFDAMIKVVEGYYREIKKNKEFSYLSVKPNHSRPYTGFDYFRYNTHIRTIWERSPSEFIILTHVQDDVEAILKCMKKFYFTQDISRNKSLVHSSLIQIRGKGILIPGSYRSGKTTLTVRFLEELGGIFISEGNTLISYDEQNLRGFYLPRTVYARFSIISSSSKLRPLLENISLTEANQIFDRDALERIISSRAFNVDAGLSMSRARFVELLKTTSSQSTEIHKIIFPQYREHGFLDIQTIQEQEAFQRLKEREHPKKTDFCKVEKQYDIKPPEETIILPQWVKGIDCYILSFRGYQDLSKTVLEDLLE
jgi:hypothetical protein